VGELSPELQPKLLRVLDRRQVKTIGSNRYRTVDVRLVAATNRNLRAQVNTRRFRADLYYRLAVVVVRIPPLRDRPDDIPLLAERILAVAHGRDPAARRLLGPDFVAHLVRQSWPGNVRELKNYLERALAGAAAREDLATAPGRDGSPAGLVDARLPYRAARERWTAALERRYLVELLELHGGNVSTAARAAKTTRVNLYRLLWKHGLR
jgi:DNA-binding NtrC family response regulator